MLISRKIRTILFDLDGTLIDHFQCIYKCYLYAAEQLGIQPKDFATVKDTVGGSIHITLGELMGETVVHEAVEHFRDHYKDIMYEDIQLMPGSSWLLEHLCENGYRLSLFTNKLDSQARAICKHLGLDIFLDDVIGSQDHPTYVKPHKKFTEYALNKLDATPTTSLLIGDSLYDIDAAACIQMPVYLVTTGSHTKEQLENHSNKAWGIYNNLYDLGKKLFSLKPPIEKEVLPNSTDML